MRHLTPLCRKDNMMIGRLALYERVVTRRRPVLYQIQLECGPMPNVMAAMPNIGGALCSTPQSLADVHYSSACSNATNIGELKTWMQSEFCTWQNSVRDKSPRKCKYSVPAHETAKHRARFGFWAWMAVGITC